MIAWKRVGYTGHSFGGFVSLAQAMKDRRVSVVVPMAPAANMASVVGNLSMFPIPFLMMGGDLDETLDFGPYMWQPYNNMPRPKAFLRFLRGGHYTFTDMCSVDVVALAEELGWTDAEDALTDGCGEENFDPATARGIITHFTVAMFNAHLRGSPASLDYIDGSYLTEWADDVVLDKQFEAPAE
jgi:predicted dienelactone hydrolase